ncbi:MAG: hypothetical protein IJA34_13745 [Lachnospiraceae bacterium]|nr:hypothetical protein [Lachnospiraceae bacterium]
MGNIFLILLNAIKAKILPIWTKIKLWTNASFIKTRVLTGIRRFFSSMLNIKPRHEKDYYGFFGWLISRRLVIAITIVIGLLSFYYIFFVNPPSVFTQSGTGIKTYDYDSIPLRFTKGEVRIRAKSKYIAYEGNVEKGKAKGNGILYNKAGNVVYKGMFDDSMYNGKGTLYYPSGQIEYIGDFVDNEYQGNGILYRENGSIEYDGEFKDDKKDGVGSIFDSTNNKVYEGEFTKGRLNYLDFLGKTTEEVSNVYTGERVVYSDEDDFVVSMPDIDAMYYGRSDSNNVDGSIKVDCIYIMENVFWYAGKSYASVHEIKELFGRVEYEGNTYVTMPDATAIHILNEKGTEFFGDIEGKWTQSFDDAITVEEYDVDYTIYMYTFVEDGIRYNFYCKDRSGIFTMYSMEKDE